MCGYSTFEHSKLKIKVRSNVKNSHSFMPYQIMWGNSAYTASNNVLEVWPWVTIVGTR